MRFTSVATIIRGESKFHGWYPRTSFAPRLPVRFGIMILAISLCFFALTISISLSKSSEMPTDVFAAYPDIFPGQYWARAMESVFRCNFEFRSGSTYCFSRQQDDLFANISLTIRGSKITKITFTLRQNMLKLGDIVALWDKPGIQIAGYLAYLDWRNQKIKAIAYTDDGRFDYFLPVISVVFY